MLLIKFWRIIEKSSNSGFRKGKAPMGIVKKQYEKPVLIDEVNKLIQQELYKYISSEKIETLFSSSN